ncbi:MAG: galactokinase, partial [Actinobacteria bacterium]|nr:galactokinase [Actinomycetota bacterium]
DVASQGLELLIIDTQAHHALIDGGYAERRASCESVAAKFAIPSMRNLSIETLELRHNELSETEYLRARHAVTEINRVMQAVDALNNKDFIALGKLINQSHASLRDDYTVSCPELDTAVDAANKAGALGARMVGGGFGGSAIALIKAQDMESVKSSIKQAFASQSFKPPRFFTSLPSSGASARFYP